VDKNYARPRHKSGLGTSRTFGDAHLKVGPLKYNDNGSLMPLEYDEKESAIIAQPDVNEFKLSTLRAKKVKYMLFFTDGIADALQNKCKKGLRPF
jgi:hypothetical protein